MLPFIEAQRAAIAELCRRFHVRRLDVFGSAARGTDFDPSRSDVDLLVSYLPDIYGISASIWRYAMLCPMSLGDRLTS